MGRTVRGWDLPAGYSEDSRGGGGEGVGRVTGTGAMLGGGERTEREPRGPKTRGCAYCGWGGADPQEGRKHPEGDRYRVLARKLSRGIMLWK